MAKKSKKSLRTTYVNKFKRDIEAVSSEAMGKFRQMKPQWLIIRDKTMDLEKSDFPKTLDGERDYRKHEKLVDECIKLYKEFMSYTQPSTYAEITRSFMIELKDGETAEDWDVTYKKYKEQLDDMANTMSKTYREFMYKLMDVISLVRKVKREAAKQLEEVKDDVKEDMKESVESEVFSLNTENKHVSVEDYILHADEIRQKVYEKCESGELTVEEREEIIGHLNGYILNRPSIEGQILEVMNEYLNDEITGEEYVNIMEGFEEEYPDALYNIRGGEITDRFDMIHEMIQESFDAGTISKSDAIQMLKEACMVEEYESVEHYTSMIDDDEFPAMESVESDDDVMREYCEEYRATIREVKKSGDETLIESTRTEAQAVLNQKMDAYMESVNARNKVSEVQASYMNMLNTLSVMEESGDITGDQLIEEYRNATTKYYELMTEAIMNESSHGFSHGQVITESGDFDILMAASIGACAGIIAGQAINTKKCKKVLKAYEDLHNPSVKIADLNAKSISVTDAVEKYFPMLKGDVRDTTMPYMRCVELEKGGQPFMTAIDVESGKKHRVYTKFHDEAAKGHEKYYVAFVTIVKFKQNTVELKDFAKTIMKEMKDAKKGKLPKESTLEIPEEKKSESESSDTSSSTSLEPKEEEIKIESVAYENVLDVIEKQYEEGRYTLEQKQELLMSAKRRFAAKK